MIEPKVSIITPCYNGENHLEYFLDSLLAQDYSNVEFFFVDDGSTDKTKEIFYSYKPKLVENGWSVKYIYKDNGGAASAINAGLPLITGKYFIWMDSDDILYPNSILKKVKYMEEHPEYEIACSPLDMAKEKDRDTIVRVKDFVPDDKMFKHILKEEQIIWSLGNIVKTDALFDVIPNKTIPECSGGQNCQILMPLFYKYSCGYINESLAKCIIRNSSHSHTNQKKFLNRRFQMIEIWVKTILTLRYANIIEKFIYILFVLINNFSKILKHYLSIIFSVKIKKNRIIITILGIKIKIKRKEKGAEG